jgi:mediator of RNA polymerase II transcription subunit 31
MPKRKRTATPVGKTTLAATPPSPKSPTEEALRFEVELEFVQCLANPDYIQHLSHQGTLEEPNFIKYLAYLHATWTQPDYSKFLTFPHCLAYLRLLQEPTFRQMANDPRFMTDVKYQRDLHFFHHKTAEVVDPSNP